MFDLQHIQAYVQIALVLLLAVMVWTHRQAVIGVFKKDIGVAEKAVETAQPLLSVTPLAPYVNACEEALKAAQIGVDFAEQLFNNGTTPADQRKVVASDYAANWLKTLGVTMDARLAHVLDGAIEAAVYALPPSKTPAADTAVKADAPTAPVQAPSQG